jgi:Flp pilus assembly protein TadG
MIHLKTTLSRRTGRARRGAAVTELAMVLPIILVFLLGIIDFALVMYAYGTVSEASRAGARYAVVHGSRSAAPVGPTANDATVESVVRANAPALTAAHLTVTSSWGAGSNDATCPVTVTATYDCTLCVARLGGLGCLTVKGSTTMLITH